MGIRIAGMFAVRRVFQIIFRWLYSFVEDDSGIRLLVLGKLELVEDLFKFQRDIHIMDDRG